MYRIAAPAALAAALALTACAPHDGPARDTSVPMHSLADYGPARLAGTWHPVAGTAGCRAAGPVRFAESGGRLVAEGTLCGARLRGPVAFTAPGRFSAAPISEPLWVLWADADDRTLVLGTPSGRIGAILDRSPRPSPDRMRAAQEILAWNGYTPGAVD
ncbi:MAG: lipocalin [Gemmobacter sp.]